LQTSIELDPRDLPAVEIYTDGACSPNPGPGGWAAILRYGQTLREVSGSCGLTTNNRAEMTAVIKALSALKRPCKVRLSSDSKYVVIGGAKGPGRKKYKLNRDLWGELDEAAARHEIEWCWVRGHNGDPLNERADRLAVAAINRGRS
jgi:ribonuclease HI